MSREGSPLTSTIEELGSFFTREGNAAHNGKTSGMDQPNGAAAPAIPR
jgi:hypothetical protein